MSLIIRRKLWNTLLLCAAFFLSGCDEANEQSSSKLLVHVSAQETRLIDDALGDDTSRVLDASDFGAIPTEVDFIKVQVLSEQGQLLASRSVADTEASFRMQIPDGIPLVVHAYAFSGEERLYYGELLVEALRPGSENNVSITLLSEVSVTVRSSTLARQANDPIDLSQLILVEGLSNTSLNYAVNGIEGGNKNIGFVTDTGLYTPPPHIPEDLNVEISVTPVVAPSFGELIEVTISPSLINPDWFEDAALKACVESQGLSLVAELTVLICPSFSGNDFPILFLAGLEKLTALEVIDFSQHNINAIPPLSSLALLKDLNLSSNSLGDIAELAKLTSLLFLNLSGNPAFTSTSPSNPLDPLIPLASLKELQTLDLSCIDMNEAPIDVLRQALPNTKITSVCAPSF